MKNINSIIINFLPNTLGTFCVVLQNTCQLLRLKWELAFLFGSITHSTTLLIISSKINRVETLMYITLITSTELLVITLMKSMYRVLLLM